MYHYVSAIALPLQGGAQWKEVDVSSQIVAQLYRQYREVVLTLGRFDETIYVSMETLRARFSTFGSSLAVLLQSLAGEALDTLPTLPNDRVRYVRYENATRTAYQARLAKYGHANLENYPRSEKTDLILSRPAYDTDMRLVHQHCLVSVNGFYHPTEYENSQLYVIDGGRSAQRYNSPHVGITSFLDIAPIRRHRLTESMVAPESGLRLKDALRITSPETLEGKSYFLVLGGYLVFPEDGKLWMVNDHTLQLDLSRQPYIERLLESRYYINLDPLQLSLNDLNPDAIYLDEAWSDAVIRRYLSLSQTFLVVVDTPRLFTQKIPLRTIYTPGLFTTVQEPRRPLLGQYGRSLEYWKTRENRYWAINVQDSFQRHYLFSRQRPDTLNVVTGQLSFDHPFHHSQAFLLEIGAYQ